MSIYRYIYVYIYLHMPGINDYHPRMDDNAFSFGTVMTPGIYICIYICSYIYAYNKPPPDQFHVRVCSCPLCI